MIIRKQGVTLGIIGLRLTPIVLNLVDRSTIYLEGIVEDAIISM